MAIKNRGNRAYFLAVVAEQRTVATPDGPVYEIVMHDAGKDRDELVLRTPWRGALVEFPVGTSVDVEMLKQRPR